MSSEKIVPGFAHSDTTGTESVGEYQLELELVSRDKLVRVGGMKKVDAAHAYSKAWTVRKEGRMVFCSLDRDEAHAWAQHGGSPPDEDAQ